MASISLHGSMAAFHRPALHAKRSEDRTPAWRAMKDTLLPGCIASSIRGAFSAIDLRGGRCTKVITSTREIGPSGAFAIVVFTERHL